MKKHLRPIFSLLLLTAILVLPFFVFAASNTVPVTSKTLDMLNNVAVANGGYQESSLPKFIGLVIRVALSLLGVVFTILIILGGFNWMLAEGNEQKIEKAQNYIRRSIIGLVITLSAWAIWTFIFDKLIAGR